MKNLDDLLEKAYQNYLKEWCDKSNVSYKEVSNLKEIFLGKFLSKIEFFFFIFTNEEVGKYLSFNEFLLARRLLCDNR